MSRWCIYYEDGSTYSGDPFSAPTVGVQVIAFEEDGKTSLSHSKEAFYWKDGWFGCDQLGLFDYLMSYRGPKAVLFGRTMRTDEFWKTVKRAQIEGVNG